MKVFPSFFILSSNVSINDILHVTQDICMGLQLVIVCQVLTNYLNFVCETVLVNLAWWTGPLHVVAMEKKSVGTNQSCGEFKMYHCQSQQWFIEFQIVKLLLYIRVCSLIIPPFILHLSWNLSYPVAKWIQKLHVQLCEPVWSFGNTHILYNSVLDLGHQTHQHLIRSRTSLYKPHHSSTDTN